jgi:type I restriction enzyme S subunit
MSPEKRLLQRFEQISEAPGAIARLRHFILWLAVRGKLVERDPADEPAIELLSRIQRKRNRFLADESTRGQSSLPQIAVGELPFEFPRHWEVARVCGVGLLSGGMTPSKDQPDYWDGDINWFSPKDIKTDELIDSELKITAKAIADTGLQVYKPGCLFMVARSGILKRTFPVSINRVEAAVNQDIKVLRPFITGLERFFQIAFQGMTVFVLSTLVKTGTTVQSLKYDEFARQPIPIPPLQEQSRIISKVDELMVLCDHLEVAQAKRERRRDRLVAATLHGLNNGEAGAPKGERPAFEETARFYFNHLPRLTTRPEHIQQLRQTILSLAVCGKFGVPGKWPSSDQPLGDVATLQNGYAFKSEWFVSSGVRLLRNVNVSHGVLCWDDSACLPEKSAAEFGRFQLKENDIVLSLDRPFITTGTKVARVRRQDLPALLLQRVGRFVVNPDLLHPDYLLLWLISPHFSKQINPGRSNGVPHVSSKQVEAAEIFVPAVREQQRIVTKVKELMLLCDDLEVRLGNSASTRRSLLEATLQEALGSAASVAAAS